MASQNIKSVTSQPCDKVGIPISEPDPKERVKKFLKNALEGSEGGPWAASLLPTSLTLHTVTTSPSSTTTFLFTVDPTHTNRLGNLHGGCIATIFDIATTTSLCPLASPGFWAYAGVSRNLNVTYLRPAHVGDRIMVRSEVVQIGRRMCTLKGEMRKEGDGVLIAMAEHGKVSVDPEVGGKL